jgi:ribosomal protein L29
MDKNYKVYKLREMDDTKLAENLSKFKEELY